MAATVAACSSSPVQPDQPRPTTTVPPSGYSVLGDSYASGEGTGDYTPSSDVAGDRCHRSPTAYGPLLDRARDLGVLTFVACAGAVTADLVSPNHEGFVDPDTKSVEPAQISTVPPHTRIVTLTVGGNDAGFASVLASCVSGKTGPIAVYPRVFGRFDGCANDQKLIADVADRLRALAGKTTLQTPAGTPIVPIAEVLNRIHQQAPQAKIYLVGYPALFGLLTKSCHVGDVDVVHVPLFGDVRIRVSVSVEDAAWLNRAAVQLNDVLKDAVASAKEKGVPATFVDVSPYFDGHRLCDRSESWIAPVSGGADITARKSIVDSSSFHPTRAGQQDGYQAALLAAGVS